MGPLGLLFSFHKKPSQLFQRVGAIVEALEFRQGIIDQGVGFSDRRLDPKESRIRYFLGGCIFAGCLSQLLRRLGYVEDVVHNLKCEADRESKRPKFPTSLSFPAA